MAKKKFYRYSELDDKAKKKARKDYLKGWRETHPKDSFSDEDVDEFLRDHEEDDAYDLDGKLIDCL